MRRQHWVAAALVACAVWIGGLAGCGGGQSGDHSGSETSTETPSTTAGGETGASGEISLAVGQRVLQERCVLCHGQGGKGDGPGGAALNPKPQDWTNHDYMGTRTDEQLYESINNGKGSMPAWGKTGILTEAEMRSAILAVRSYDPKWQGGS